MNRTRRERPRIEIANSTLRPGLGSSSVITAHFDGAYNGRTSSYGVIIRRDGRVLWRASGSVPGGAPGSCNVAEYAGLLAALRYLLDHGLNNERIVIIGDSLMVVRQMFGRWRVKKGRYVTMAAEAKTLLMQFPHITGRWTPRENNVAADRLSKAAGIGSRRRRQRWRERYPVG
jgi:ribonuclease HI